MKKILKFPRLVSLFCLLAIISGLFAAATPISAKQASETISDGELLVGLGILNPDYVTEEDKILTRAEFVAVAMSLCTIEVGDITDVYFTDVPYNHKYAYEINKAYKLGYVQGFGDGSYKPDENITLEQATAVIMKIIDCDMLVKAAGDSLTAAYRYGFMDGVDLSEEITFKKAVRLVRNILESKTVELSIAGDNTTSIKINENGEHFFDKLFDIYIETGTVESVDNISYSEGETAGDGYVIIDGEKYLKGGLDLRKYIGQRVVYYYKDLDYIGEIKLVLAEDDNSVTIDSEDIVSVIKNADSYTVHYEAKGRYDKINVSAYYDCIYNGSFYKDFDIASMENLFTGQVTFVSRDNKSRTKYDLLIVDEYRTAILEDVSYSDETLYFSEKTLFGKNASSYKMPNKYDIYDSNGIAITFENLKSGYVVLIAQNNEGDYAKILASNTLEPHKLNSYSGEDKTITLDDVIYNLSRDFSFDNNRFIYSEELAYYFDAKGNVTAVSDDSLPSERYGYFINWYRDEFDDTISISMIDEDGDKKVFKLHSSVTVNKQKFKMENILESTELFSEDKAIPQLIKYKLTGGKIKNIYTAEDNSANTDYIGFDEKNFTCDYYKATNAFVRYNPKVIDNKYIIDMNTSIFIVPSDVKQTEKFEVVRLDYFQLDYSNLADVRVYDSDSCKSARVITLSADSLSPQGSLFVLENNITMVDEESDEVITKLTGYYEGKYKEFVMCDGVECEAVRGDCMSLTLENGKVINYQILASADMTTDIVEKNLTSSSGYNGNWVIAFGNVYKKNAGALTLRYGDRISSVAFPVLSTSYIYKVDKKLKKVSVADYNEITTDSRVFIHRASDQVKSMVLYK